jgi:hypothetical protein
VDTSVRAAATVVPADPYTVTTTTTTHASSPSNVDYTRLTTMAAGLKSEESILRLLPKPYLYPSLSLFPLSFLSQ